MPNYTRFGFNGKEFDWEVKAWQNQIDYGFRIYDPRIGRFLSTDPLTRSYPWYTPYQYAGNKPIWKIDIDGLEEADNTAARFWKNQPQIDMTNAPVKGTNAAGVPRNGVWMMKQAYAAKPEMFSEAAKNAIFVQNKMPIVDEQWVKFNPTHAEYVGQQLQHHHIDGGKMAVAIPKRLHYDFFSELHSYVKKNITGAKVKGMLGGTMNFLGTVSMFNINNPDSWINAFSGGEQPEDYIGKVKKDFKNNVYAEINKVSFEYTPIFENGQQVFNKDNSPKTYISHRTVTATFYSSYIWDEDAGEYRGVNKIATITEVWKYDRNGKREVMRID